MTALQGPQARDLTADERAERAERCYDLEQQIKEHIAKGREALWDLSETLYQFNVQNGWSALGYETAAEWLAQPEIGITKTAFYRMVRRHKELVIARQVPMKTLVQLEPSKLDMVLPYVEKGETTFDNAVEDITTMGARDLQEKYIGARALGQQEPPTGPIAGADTIDGTASEVDEDGEPITAADVGPDGQVDEEEVKRREALSYAATMIDSWIHIGGDRRKPQRQLPRLLETHPALMALARVEQCIAGGDDAPQRDEVRDEWELLVETFGLPIQEA